MPKPTNSDFNPDSIPMHKRGVSLWTAKKNASVATSSSEGIRPHEIEWLRDIVKQYDETGKSDRLIIYNNEASGQKRSENSPDFTLKRMARPAEPGYTERRSEAPVETGSEAL